MFLQVVDINTGEALGVNQPGELLIKTQYQMNGYLGKDPKEIWDEEG